MATTSRAPPTATPTPSATTRLLPPVPIAARCCTPASGPGGPTPPVAPPGSSRAGRPSAPRRRIGGADPACRFGVLVGQDNPGLPPPPDPLLDHRAADQADPNRDSGDRPGRLGRHR